MSSKPPPVTETPMSADEARAFLTTIGAKALPLPNDGHQIFILISAQYKTYRTTFAKEIVRMRNHRGKYFATTREEDNQELKEVLWLE